MKFISRLLIVVIILFIVVVGTCSALLYMALSKEPWAIILNDDTSFSSIVSMKKSIEEEAKVIYSGKFEGAREVTLTSDEINSAFNFYVTANKFSSIFGQSLSPSGGNKPCLNGGAYKNGHFLLFVSQKIPYNIPFGSYLNLSTELVPSIVNDHLEIKILSFKIGALIIPSALMNYMLTQDNTKINNLKEVKLLLEAVNSLRTKENSITILYKPKKIAELISNYSSKF